MSTKFHWTFNLHLQEDLQRLSEMWCVFAIFLLQPIPNANALTLPPVEFIKDFAFAHQLTNIVLHSLDDLSTSQLVKW